jgi:hypothetical protein
LKIFGKTIAEYFAFQKAIMILIVVVGLLRLGLSLRGVPDSIVNWVSLTGLAVVGIIYCAVQIPRTGFGGYKHLLPLFLMQSLTANLIIAAGIALAAVTGSENIYSTPEHSGPMVGHPWLHAGGHILDGLIIGPLLGWLIGSVIMFVVKKVFTGRPVSAAAAGGSR